MLYDHSPYAWLTRITGIMLKSTRRCQRIFQNLQFMLANSREMSQLFFPSEYFWISETWTANCATSWSQCAVNHQLVYVTKSMERWQNCRWSCDVPVTSDGFRLLFMAKFWLYTIKHWEEDCFLVFQEEWHHGVVHTHACLLLCF